MLSGLRGTGAVHPASASSRVTTATLCLDLPPFWSTPLCDFLPILHGPLVVIYRRCD